MNRIVGGYEMVEAPTVRRQNAVSKLAFLKTKFLIRLLVLGVFIVALSLIYIWSRIQIVQIGYELNEYTHEQQLIVHENKKLQMELSLMKSPNRVKKYAADHLNMTMPDQDRMFEINK